MLGFSRISFDVANAKWNTGSITGYGLPRMPIWSIQLNNHGGFNVNTAVGCDAYGLEVLQETEPLRENGTCLSDKQRLSL